ncbi:MAG TPA: transcriptional regulator [Flavobacteriales bacterium]|nr:transcriptional regulator [Flavobacteriales bacterium]HIN40185.1 transcriptional regulator [Flavobacteriales bacterium]
MIKYSYICNMEPVKRKLSVEKLKSVANLLKTISHPVKLEILSVLEAQEPLDVSTICSRIGVVCESSMMSHHLAKMKDNGILVSDKIGKQVYYKIADRHILKIFDCMENCDLV